MTIEELEKNISERNKIYSKANKVATNQQTKRGANAMKNMIPVEYSNQGY